MKNEHTIIRDEMRKLISKSCILGEERNNEAYLFQKSLLKFFFGVADVTIDYKKKTITLWNSSPENPSLIYSLAEARGSKIRYTSLEETLKGCLEKGEAQDRFYRSMLYHYNHVRDAAIAFKSA